MDVTGNCDMDTATSTALTSHEPCFLREQHEGAKDRSPGIICSWMRKEIKSYNFNEEGDICESSFGCDLFELSTYCFSNFIYGLACAYNDFEEVCNYYLVNPSTQECAKVYASKCKDREGVSIGLGLDAATGKFKLVRMFDHDGLNSSGCEVLTLGTNEWRYIGETPCWVGLTRPVFLRGSLYWKAGIRDSTGMHALTKILVLDLETEKFSVVQPPQTIPLINCFANVDIQEVTGHVSLTICQTATPQIRIWMLKDNEEWFEMCSIGLENCNRYGIVEVEPKVIGVAGKMILVEEGCHMRFRSRINCYHLDSKTFREIYDGASPNLLIYWGGLLSPRKLVADQDACQDLEDKSRGLPYMKAAF